MLRSLPLANFDILLNAIKRKGRPVSFRKRQVIFSASTPCDSLYFIEEGLAKICVTSPDGTEAIVSILSKGHFLGQECLQEDFTKGRDNDAVALTNCRAHRIERRAMLHLLRDDRVFSQIFISHLIGQIDQLSARIAEGLLYRSTERLARTLLSVRQFRGSDKYHLPRGLSQGELACMIGATRQRVNAVMRQFRKLGLIDSQGTEIHDSIRQIILQRELPRGPKPAPRPRGPGNA